MNSADEERAAMEPLIDDKASFKLINNAIIITDSSTKKTKKRGCLPSFGSPSTIERTVPFEDLIWIEAQGSRFILSYATHKGNHTHLEISLPLSPDVESIPSDVVQGLLDRAYGSSKMQKRAYILINPNAGPGGSLGHWEKSVKPMFAAAKMQIDVVILKRGGEATDLARNVDIDKYDAIIACSGDGGPYEIFNGLGQRKDALRALSKLAVGHIPCGSGNALALNLYGSNDPATAALGIIKGSAMPVDLMSVTQGNKRILSFLSQSVGLVAECDLGTEHLRWMGPKRFDVGVVQRLLQKKSYPCDIAIKVEIADKEAIVRHYKKHMEIDGTLTGGAIRAEYDAESGLPALQYGTINDPVPGDWEKVNGDKMSLLYCGNLAYMAPNANFFPAALPTDGYMDFVTVDADLPLGTTINTLTAVEKEDFFALPHVSYRKISAFRIIPKNQKDGYISIDGERIPFQPFQVEVSPGLGRMLSKASVFQANGPKLQ